MNYVKEKHKFSDERVKLCNETIGGVRLVKMYAWENAFVSIIKLIRRHELWAIFKMMIMRIIDRTLSWSIVLIATFVPFIIYSYTGGELSSAIIFSSL